ncbi:antitoxin MazE-like protein [Burkholderia pseudomallei]|uniref:antitoxin MazE-like protein n=1 Tax=Burkholderia pseudomallei TaxID=28450 RepID=UPI001592BB4F|nr:antitoxin MazE-like protein [Burkholderia pseudomallei]NVH98164.1 antitoxin MazE family protein [Burkholderia pseudomallei]
MPRSRHAQSRERLRAAGYGQVKFRVLDARSPELIAMLRCQCRNLRGDPAELDAIAFGETAAGLIESWERLGAGRRPSVTPCRVQFPVHYEDQRAYCWASFRRDGSPGSGAQGQARPGVDFR